MTEIRERRILNALLERSLIPRRPAQRTEVQLGDRGLATIRLADVGLRD
jgi:hypothetical protein